MKEIVVNSKTHGPKTIMIDDCDYEWAIKEKWHIRKSETGICYAVIRNRKETKIMHRIILNAPKGALVDHIDMNGLNNQRSNIRLCTKSQNMMNRGVQKNNTTGYKGVWYRKDRGKYQVDIKLNRKKIVVGYYRSILDAVNAYNNAALKYHGEFARLNQINHV